MAAAVVSHRTPVRTSSLLTRAAVFYAVGSGLHTIDHLRRGLDTGTGDVVWAGQLGIVVSVAVVTLVLTRHRLAPLFAAAASFPLALGYIVVHMTPARGWLSDSLPDGHVDGWTWAAATFEIVGALVLGCAAIHTLRHGDLEEPATG